MAWQIINGIKPNAAIKCQNRARNGFHVRWPPCMHGYACMQENHRARLPLCRARVDTSPVVGFQSLLGSGRTSAHPGANQAVYMVLKVKIILQSEATGKEIASP